MIRGELKLLIVDDDADDVLLVRDLLQEAFNGLSVVAAQAASVPEGQARLEAGRYDLILLDYRLGAEDGLEFLRQVRAWGFDVPVILMTGQGDEQVAVRAMKAGAIDYLVKSKLNAEVLRTSVRHSIELHEQDRLRKQAEESLRELNGKLVACVRDLERKGRESALLNELGGSLLVCSGALEGYGVIGRFCQQMFPERPGALYVMDPEAQLLESVAWWGNGALKGHVFSPHDCCALRRGRLYLVEAGDGSLRCQHLQSEAAAGHVCVPLMAQGETLGVLFVQGAAQVAEAVGGRISAQDKQAVGTVAEHIALGLANLKLREALRGQSTRDPLTGLFNRRYLEECLRRDLHRALRYQRPLAVILLDVDRFKTVNDTRGHDAGDTALREIGRLLLAGTRSADFCCRMGGDEFLLVLPETSRDAAWECAEKLRHDVRELQIEYEGAAFGPVTISGGVAAAPEEGTTATELLKAADSALYRAKAAGRDCVMRGEPSPAVEGLTPQEPAAPAAPQTKEERYVNR